MKVRPLARSTALAVSLSLTSGVFAGATIEELVLGPANEGGVYTVSKKGVHVAFIGTKGSKVAVKVDGVDGPVFDELYTPTSSPFYSPAQLAIVIADSGGINSNPMSPVIMSDDGAHYAYAGRQGNDYVVIHDGKEVGRGPRANLNLGLIALALSPHGRFVYWSDRSGDPGQSTSRLMVNGKPGPEWPGNSIPPPVFSGDDSRYAYTVVGMNDRNTQVLVIDGKEAGYAGTSPAFTADGKVLLAISYAAGKSGLLANGKLVVPGIGVKKIVVAPVGGRYGAVVTTHLENSMGVDELMVDGKVVKGTAGARSVVFSPDGKHYAAACENTAARAMFMVVDGNAGGEYQGMGADSVWWTADSSKVFYTAMSNGRQFLIADDQEFPLQYFIGGPNNPIHTPAQGARYAFGTRDGSNRNFTVVVDGKSVLPPNFSPVDGTLSFTADGSRYAYMIGPIGRQGYVGYVIDGEVHDELMPLQFGQSALLDLETNAYLFSPDGKHIAYVASGADPTSAGLYVDQTLVHPSRTAIGDPAFSPDGRHLFWAAVEINTDRPGRHTAVYVDDELATNLDDSYFLRTKGCWEMGSDGALTVVSIFGNDVKRLRISAPDETNVDAMIAGAGEKRAKAAADAEAAQVAAAAEAEAAKQAAIQETQRKREEAIAAAQKQREEAIAARKKAYDEAVAAKKKAYEEALAKRKAAAEAAAAKRRP